MLSLESSLQVSSRTSSSFMIERPNVAFQRLLAPLHLLLPSPAAASHLEGGQNGNTCFRKHRTMGNDKVFPPPLLDAEQSSDFLEGGTESPCASFAPSWPLSSVSGIKFMMQLFSDLLDFGNRIACSSSTGHGRRR